MPGIIGFTTNKENSDASYQTLQKMQELITYYDFYTKDTLFKDKNFFATKVHTNIISQIPQPYFKEGIYIWLDGEFYNQTTLMQGFNIQGSTDLEILGELYLKNKNDFSFLEKIDGFYSAVIYDSVDSKVHIFTDRYGLRQLYWTNCDDCFLWSSEVKTFLEHPSFKASIDPLAVKQFFELGHLLENRTWFNNVELVPSGTVITWDMNVKRTSFYQYWWWDRIKPYEGVVNEKEVTEELGRLFINAVHKRCEVGNNIGIQLSGGLDSRAILAATSNDNSQIQALTFGKEKSDDVKFASQAARIKSVNHHILGINEENWLPPRFQGVWWTDGMADLIHMHGIIALEKRKEIAINLNGYAGDIILGGSRIKYKEQLHKGMDINLLSKVMNCETSLLEGFENYKELNKLDYYFLQNRVRRFTYGGTKLTLTGIEHRKPFFDNDLIEFNYSLPDSYRFNSYIYKKMLLNEFPDLFNTIPWSKTGVPIGHSAALETVYSSLRMGKHKIIRQLSRIGINYETPNDYTNYAKWMRIEPAKKIIKEILLNKNAIYRNYIDHDVASLLEEHFNGRNREYQISKYLTFELWLQQVYEKKYRLNEI